MSPTQILSSKLHHLKCADEGGIGSGVRRDWLNSMMASMLDSQTGLFESADGGHTWQPCPLAHFQDQHVVYFEMLGQHPTVATRCHLWSPLNQSTNQSMNEFNVLGGNWDPTDK